MKDGLCCQLLQNMRLGDVLRGENEHVSFHRNPTATKTRETGGNPGIPVASSFCFPTRQSTGRGVRCLGRVFLSLPLSLSVYRSPRTHLPFPVARALLPWVYTSGWRGDPFHQGFHRFSKRWQQGKTARIVIPRYSRNNFAE